MSLNLSKDSIQFTFLIIHIQIIFFVGAYYLAAQECEAVARELLAQQVNCLLFCMHVVLGFAEADVV